MVEVPAFKFVRFHLPTTSSIERNRGLLESPAGLDSGSHQLEKIWTKNDAKIRQFEKLVDDCILVETRHESCL
jgi:hypothetical protein